VGNLRRKNSLGGQPSFHTQTAAPSAVERCAVESLLLHVGAGAREMVAAATESLVSRFGGRGSCILIDDRARVVYSTAVPDLTELPLDLGRYPEIDAALSSGQAVAVEDVRASPLLRSVAGFLPDHLGAVAVVPLLARGRCLGVLMAQSTHPRAIPARDLAEAQLEGRLAGTLLDLQFGDDLPCHLRRAAAPGRITLFPIAAGSSVAVAASAAEAPASRPVRRRILIAEDDPDQASALQEILTEERFDVVVTADGARALEQAWTARPDLIMLDAHMPVLNGFETAKKLVDDVRTQGIPILLVSAAEDLLPWVRGLNVNTVDFLRKPYRIMELLARIEKSLNQARERAHLRDEASIDDLTGLGNQRFLREHLALEQSRIARYGTASSIVVVDVDKFKEINDKHGHPAGSRILKAIGESLRREIRETDLAARYGGDEFVIVLPHTTLAEGGAFAERLLSSIQSLRPEGVEVTMSIGVAGFASSEGRSVDVLLARADAAAYRAKRAGGNRVCLYDRALDHTTSGMDKHEREWQSRL
jgi:two-component system cell cycle response regulator